MADDTGFDDFDPWQVERDDSADEAALMKQREGSSFLW
jgi:hypothetical protein